MSQSRHPVGIWRLYSQAKHARTALSRWNFGIQGKTHSSNRVNKFSNLRNRPPVGHFSAQKNGDKRL